MIKLSMKECQDKLAILETMRQAVKALDLDLEETQIVLESIEERVYDLTCTLIYLQPEKVPYQAA